MSLNYPQRTGKSRNDNPKGKTLNRDVNAAHKVQLALQFKAAGMTLDEIAIRAGYGSKGAAHNAIKRELQRNVSPKVEEYRANELNILETMHREIWEMFIDKSYKGRLFAADRLLAIAERKSRLLGLDVPVDQAINQNVVVVREVPQGYLGIVEAPQQV